MDKWEYLKKLENRLSILDEKERKKVIKKYEAMISESEKEGKTEEEALKKLGDVDKLAKEILAEYKISKDYTEKSNDFEGLISRFINYVVEITKSFIDKLEKKDFRAIAEIIIYILIAMFAFWVIRLPFYIIEAIGHGIFNAFYNPLSRGLILAWSFMVNIAYIILIIWIIVIILNKLNKNKKPEATRINSKKETIKEDTKEEVKVKTSKGAAEVTLDVFSVFIKVLIVIMMMPSFFALIGLLIALGVFIYLLIEGVVLWGPILILLGIMIILGAIIDLIFYLTFNRGGHRK